METFFQVKFNDGIRLDCKLSPGFQAHVGEYVIVKNDRVLDMGVITSMLGHGHLPEGNSDDLPEIINHATDADYKQREINHAREEELLAIAVDEVTNNELEMKLIKSHTTIDQSLIIFLFTAEGRIDFRQLVKTLSRRLNCRIELRQVGV
ncbi:MAG: regulatory iron-sulfur-containing complex subunit RicT, partial [Lentisphaeria bacterium]